MGPRETGMWERDSDGGELPDRASGSCHTGLISPVTRQEAQPVTCSAVQQVMKAGRMALGWQEPGAVKTKNARTRCHVRHVSRAPPSLILLHWDSCEYGLCMALMMWVGGCVCCVFHSEGWRVSICVYTHILSVFNILSRKAADLRFFSDRKTDFMSLEFCNFPVRQWLCCSIQMDAESLGYDKSHYWPSVHL